MSPSTDHIKSTLAKAGSMMKSLDIQRNRNKADQVNGKQEALCVGVFSSLFFMWGLAYGLLDIMNYHIKVAMNIHRMQAALLALSYYSAYIPGALLIGGPIVGRFGYRMGAVVGLAILAFGDEIMSVGAARLNFSIMCVAHLIVGLGVSTLERTANAYVVNIGPRQRAPLRILFAQSFAGVGTIIAPLLANAVIFDPNKSTAQPSMDVNDASKCVMPTVSVAAESTSSLDTVVKFYRLLGVGMFCLAGFFGVIFYRTQWVVEVVVTASPISGGPRWKFWKHPLVSMKYSRLWYGIVANFLNLGCQVAVAQFFIEHMRVNACGSDKWAANYMTFAQTAFVGGRLIAAGMVSVQEATKTKIIQSICRPRLVLCAFLAGAVAFTGAGVAATGTTAIAMACLIMFAEAPSFPMIFESATAGFDKKWTPTAETLMILSISGGGLQPLLMGILVDKAGISKGWALTTGCFGLVFSYTVMCNVVPSWKGTLDTVHGGEDGAGAEKTSIGT